MSGLGEFPVVRVKNIETYSETGYVPRQVVISSLSIFPDGKKIVGGWSDGTINCGILKLDQNFGLPLT